MTRPTHHHECHDCGAPLADQSRAACTRCDAIAYLTLAGLLASTLAVTIFAWAIGYHAPPTAHRAPADTTPRAAVRWGWASNGPAGADHAADSHAAPHQ